MPNLTAKQQKFVEEFLIDINVTQAAIRSGYSEHTARAIGCENPTKPDIQDAIAARRKDLIEKTGITPEKVLEELAKLGFANMQDFLRVTSDGDPYFCLSELTREQAATLAEVTVEDFTDGRGDNARDVRRIKFKLADKRAALVDIGKHLEMFKNQVEHSGKVVLAHEQALPRSTTPMMTPSERKIYLRLRDDFEWYAPRCLKIRSKSGAIIPLKLNAAQLYLHGKLEEQRAETGRVRALRSGAAPACCRRRGMRRSFPAWPRSAASTPSAAAAARSPPPPAMSPCREECRQPA